MEAQMQMAASFPEEALQHVLSFVDSASDRNLVSLVCKSWYDIERWCRSHVFIGNCYAVSPSILVRRFTDLRSITIKGKHNLADFDFVPEGWGDYALPWITALVAKYPAMEEIRLKRMVVTDEGLELIAKKLKNLRSLVLFRCEGFSTNGLASIAANCSNLRRLDLWKSEVDDLVGDWISHFPDSFTSLEFLNIECLKFKLPSYSLDCLVGRCPNLKGLHVNRPFPLTVNLLLNAPHLVDLGVGLLTLEPSFDDRTKLASAFARCTGLETFSGQLVLNPYYLLVVYPICSGLTSLNLSTSNLHNPDLVKLLRNCTNLQCLQVLDCIDDRSLEEVAVSCKELKKLRVVCSDLYDSDPSLTEQGLVVVAMGCPKLHCIVYCCSQMTNAALVTIAKHKPNLTTLRVVVLEPNAPDYITQQPLDNGFSAIVERCKNLKRFLISGLVTDRVLEHIGTHDKKLENLYLSFGEFTDLGLHHVLYGCNNLKKLMVRDCSFGGQALLANSQRLEKLKSLWMSSCSVSYQDCEMLGKKLSRLNVEFFNEKGPLHSTSNESPVENLYVYRTVAGPRSDMPTFVWSMNQKELIA